MANLWTTTADGRQYCPTHGEKWAKGAPSCPGCAASPPPAIADAAASPFGPEVERALGQCIDDMAALSSEFATAERESRDANNFTAAAAYARLRLSARQRLHDDQYKLANAYRQDRLARAAGIGPRRGVA